MMTDKNEDVKLSTTAPETKPELTDEEIASVAGGTAGILSSGPPGKTNTIPVKGSPVKA